MKTIEQIIEENPLLNFAENIISPETQVENYVEKFKRTSDFPEKGFIEIEFPDDLVVMDFKMFMGMVIIGEFYGENLTIERRNYLKILFIEEMERHFEELTDLERREETPSLRGGSADKIDCFFR